jgi:hypothetical protein
MFGDISCVSLVLDPLDKREWVISSLTPTCSRSLIIGLSRHMSWAYG